MPPDSSFNGFSPIIYHLFQTYQDPFSKGIINISASSTVTSRGNPENLLKWDDGGVWISNKSSNQYFTIEFNNYYLISGYAFRTLENEHTLKEWEINGSMNGIQWSKIDQRNENICEGKMGDRETNVTVCMVSLTKYFTMNQGVYRFIRMIQTGRNTESDEDHQKDSFGFTFYLRSFELYGKFFRPISLITCKNSIPRIHFSLLWIAFYLS